MTQFEIFEVTAETTREDIENALEDAIKEALNGMYDGDLLDMLNEYREEYGDPVLLMNDDDEINDILDGLEPVEILRLADEWDEYDTYIVNDGWGDFHTTNDVWDGVDIDDVVEWIVRNEDAHGLADLEDVFDEYNEALEYIEEREDEEAERERREEVARRVRGLALVVHAQGCEIFATEAQRREYDGDGIPTDAEKVNKITALIMELYGGHGEEAQDG